MSKEFNLIDAPAIDSNEVAEEQTVIQLDDLSLALVGGGSMTVSL